LLVEGGSASAYDRVLVVVAPEEQPQRRLLARDASSETLARRILAVQATRQQRLAIADDVIENTGTLEALREQVHSLHRSYTQRAAQRTQAP
jgi:dephospho-CoA kinase